MLTKALNLENNASYEATIEFKKNFRGSMFERSQCLIDPNADDKLDFQASIKRYSDKYSKTSKFGAYKWKPG